MLDERKRRAFDAIVWTSSLLFAAVLPVVARADSQRCSNANPAYRTECGSCHIPCRPALRGADGERTLMNRLDTPAAAGDSSERTGGIPREDAR